MRTTCLLPAAYLLDQVAGDPEWMPHPVRLMGLVITRAERLLRRPGDSRARELVCGAALTFGLVSASYVATRTLIRMAHRHSRPLGTTTEILLAWTCLAARNLQQEALAVSAALDCGDLATARRRIARIVGRDTHSLSSAEISRALIETLAESASDGIVAPIVYLAIGGAPLAMAFKAVSTLDSMIGHRDSQYLYFGKVAARLDDAANLLPSRLTAACIIATAALSPATNAGAAYRTWLQDGSRHKSPNAGQPEAAMAGALQVQLGGDNFYAGERMSAARIGSGFPAATPEKGRQAILLTATTALIALSAAMLVSAVMPRSKR